MERYCKIKVLGHGAFGKAWLVSCNKTQQAFVVKEISIPALKERDKQSAINEVKILATLKHKNIILYKEAFVNEQCLCIIMEYADDGDLAEKIRKQNGVLFMEFQIIDWFVQILIAVKYIHSLKILHRDLKSQNIFLTKEGFVKIGDFGVSRCLEGGLNQAQTAIGTPYYLSPEICQQKP
ncbi:serine/threonine-protein kinase Nek5-like [Clytia hemisphaerica]